MSVRTLALFVITLPVLAACSTVDGDFPSLERRPYENNNPIIPPVEAPQAAVLSAELTATVDALNARHRGAQEAFARDLRSVQSVASRVAGSAAGSEAWVNAHLQLSRLDKARANSVAVVREFDSLIADTGSRDASLVPLLTEAQTPIAEAVAAQNREIGRLSQIIGE